jgi:winged helix DNA-binding protein
MRITWSQVCARRLARHGLAKPVAPGRLAEQVGVICGAHAQVMSAAELSIGLRVAGVTRAHVREALWTERTIVKTYGPRGTVHLLPARDLQIWTGALLAAYEPPRRAPQLRLTDDQLNSVIAAIDEALTDEALTVDELSDAVVKATGAWAGDLVMPAFQEMWPRWFQAIQTAAHRGALCFGPNRGRKVTYISPRRWLPGFELADGPSALAEIVRRYLYAYGPATPQQFARWFGVSPPRAVQVFNALSAELEPVQVDGASMWIAANDLAAPEEAPAGVRLLPYFDAYVVGCHPREHVFPGEAAKRALTGGQAGNVQVLLVDGVVNGVWHQRRSGRKLALTVEPFARLTAKQRRELDDEAERIGEILEGTPELTIGEVTVRPHA